MPSGRRWEPSTASEDDILLVQMKAALDFLTQAVRQILAAELPRLGLERQALTARSHVHEKGA